MDNISKLDSIKKKKEETSIIKYGEKHHSKNNNIKEKVIKVLNNYSFINNKKEVLDLIINDLKNTYLDEDNNGIKVSTIDDIYNNDDYVFLLGFNKENIPVLYKDNEYFVGTVGQLALRDNIKDKSALYRVIKGEILTGSGWLIVQNVDTSCSTTGVEYIVKYQWQHTDGRLLVKNCYEMSKFLEEKFENNVKKVIRGIQKSIKGWKIESIVE